MLELSISLKSTPASAGPKFPPFPPVALKTRLEDIKAPKMQILLVFSGVIAHPVAFICSTLFCSTYTTV